MLRGASLLGLAFAGLPCMLAHAAPPPAADDPEGAGEGEDACPEMTPEEAKFIAGRELFKQGRERYDAGDYLGAIEKWSQVISLLPEREADIRVSLAHAHRRTYESDADLDHLRAALELFGAELERAALSEEQRASLEGEVLAIEAEFAALAEADARVQAEREEAIRFEQLRLAEIALAESEAKHRRNIYYGVGGTITGLGLGSAAAMAAQLGLGASLEREGEATTAREDVEPSEYAVLLERGESLNRGALAAGIVGGVLVVSGASLLLVAALRHQRELGGDEDREPRAALAPELGGLQLRFR